MAFTTISGSGGSATTIAGTSGVDFASITTIENYFVGAQQDADTIGITANLSKGTLKGGQGADTISFTAGSSIANSFVNSNSNDDTVGVAAAGANFFTSTVLGGQGNDNFFLNTLNGGTVNGNKDTDTVAATTVNTDSTIYGGQGNDSVNATAATSSTISGDIGDDLLTLGNGSHSAVLVDGGADNDIINLTAGAASTSFNNVTLTGGDGNDQILGSVVMVASTGTVVNGGAGTDTITFTNFVQDITANGGEGADGITGGIGNDTLLGDAGNDNVTGGAGADTLTGGTGNDTLVLGGGVDRIIQASGDSTQASAGFSAGTLAAGTTMVFANGVDSVTTGLVAGAAGERIANGVGDATLLVATDVVTALAAGNYVVSGTWTAGTNTFAQANAGNDLLFIQTATGGNLTGAAAAGTTSMILIGSGFAGTNIQNNIGGANTAFIL